eukprot:6208361-Pleurochrysis_carterae.AAC.4
MRLVSVVPRPGRTASQSRLRQTGGRQHKGGGLVTESHAENQNGKHRSPLVGKERHPHVPDGVIADDSYHNPWDQCSIETESCKEPWPAPH